MDKSQRYLSLETIENDLRNRIQNDMNGIQRNEEGIKDLMKRNTWLEERAEANKKLLREIEILMKEEAPR